MTEKPTIVQSCAPIYRSAPFRHASHRGWNIVCGLSNERSGVSTHAALVEDGVVEITTARFFGPAVWLRLHPRLLVTRELVVLEGSPYFLQSWALGTVRRLLGRRTAFWGHASIASHSRLVQALWQVFLRLPHVWIAYSELEAMSLRQLRGRTVAAPNPIEPPQRAIQALGRAILVVGRLSEEKGVSLELADLLPHLPPGTELVIVGDGSDRPRIEEVARGHNHVNVHLTGALAPGSAELEEAFDRSGVLWCAGYAGLNVFDALSRGVPVVAVEGRHSPELAAGASASELVSIVARQHLASALLGALDQPMVDAKRRRDAREIRESFSVERWFEGMEGAL